MRCAPCCRAGSTPAGRRPRRAPRSAEPGRGARSAESPSMTAAANAVAAARHRKRSAVEVLSAVRRPKVGVMLALGFASGLPFLLTGNTLGYWLRDQGTSLKAIGFLSWVGLAYTLKVFWAPLVDRLDLPVF